MKLKNIFDFWVRKHFEPEIGSFAFGNGKFSDDPKAYHNLIGVVGWINPDKNAPKGDRGLIISLSEPQVVWKCAMQYCQACEVPGFKLGSGFLPSENTLHQMFLNTKLINDAIGKVGSRPLRGWYWSSSSHGQYHAYFVHAATGMVDVSYKGATRSMRCVWAF